MKKYIFLFQEASKRKSLSDQNGQEYLHTYVTCVLMHAGKGWSPSRAALCISAREILAPANPWHRYQANHKCLYRDIKNTHSSPSLPSPKGQGEGLYPNPFVFFSYLQQRRITHQITPPHSHKGRVKEHSVSTGTPYETWFVSLPQRSSDV